VAAALAVRRGDDRERMAARGEPVDDRAFARRVRAGLFAEVERVEEEAQA